MRNECPCFRLTPELGGRIRGAGYARHHISLHIFFRSERMMNVRRIYKSANIPTPRRRRFQCSSMQSKMNRNFFQRGTVSTPQALACGALWAMRGGSSHALSSRHRSRSRGRVCDYFPRAHSGIPNLAQKARLEARPKHHCERMRAAWTEGDHTCGRVASWRGWDA